MKMKKRIILFVFVVFGALAVWSFYIDSNDSIDTINLLNKPKPVQKVEKSNSPGIEEYSKIFIPEQKEETKKIERKTETEKTPKEDDSSSSSWFFTAIAAYAAWRFIFGKD